MIFFCFFKQKTAYEMRISDWSSDVCSSDLDIAVPEFGAKSDTITGKGAATAIVFRANKNGTFEYLCTLPGHKAAGMFGKLIVGEPQQVVKSDALDIAQDPTAVGKDRKSTRLNSSH